MKSLAFVLVALCAQLFVQVQAQAQQSVQNDPGFFNLSAIESWFPEEAYLEVNVGGALLDLVRQAARHEDAELSDMLGKLRGVYVRGYKVAPGEAGRIAERTSRLAQSLSSSGWETVVRVREEEERVDVFLKTAQNRISGLVVMVVDEEETVFVNIVGEIDPEDIGRIGGRFNVPDIPGIGNSSGRNRN